MFNGVLDLGNRGDFKWVPLVEEIDTSFTDIRITSPNVFKMLVGLSGWIRSATIKLIEEIMLKILCVYFYYV